MTNKPGGSSAVYRYLSQGRSEVVRTVENVTSFLGMKPVVIFRRSYRRRCDIVSENETHSHASSFATFDEKESVIQYVEELTNNACATDKPILKGKMTRYVAYGRIGRRPSLSQLQHEG